MPDIKKSTVCFRTIVWLNLLTFVLIRFTIFLWFAMVLIQNEFHIAIWATFVLVYVLIGASNLDTLTRLVKSDFMSNRGNLAEKNQ